MGNPIDHVLPWSQVGIDGLANLVLACARCNGDKSGAMPAIEIIDRVLDRDLARWSRSLPNWPGRSSATRVIAAARGLYRGNPGIPTWAAFKRSVQLDVSFPPPWMSFADPDGSDS